MVLVDLDRLFSLVFPEQRRDVVFFDLTIVLCFVYWNVAVSMEGGEGDVAVAMDVVVGNNVK